MKEEKPNNCTDCLHCKVSAKSTKNKKMCFCSETKKQERHKIQYWKEKKVCRKFFDLSDDELPRLLLLRKRA
jgi:hypothetical protein